MSGIVAVIPTYNSAELVVQRVTELQTAAFKKIVVCDDHSSDNTVAKLEAKFGDTIEIVVGSTNLGPGGNRNRVLQSNTFKESKFLLFVDADCQLIPQSNLVSIIDSDFKYQTVGVVGYGILNSLDEPMRWNYGKLMHPVHEAADQRLEELLESGIINKDQFISGAPERAASLRMLPELEPKDVGWVAEGCFAVRSDLFDQIGGFSEQMRYHETHDFNARVKEAGFKTIFNPIQLARHLEHDSRMERRDEDFRNGQYYYYQKHWNMSKEVFDHLFDS